MTSTLPISFSITHITASSAILHIDGINFITDPVFSPAGKEWDMGPTVLKNTKGPALKLRDLPVIDFVLLSHEDHPDNLDELGRRHLDDRRVLTAQDGARKLAPRPGVKVLEP
ncbi:Zn-dependent hydrolase [Colletotrichum scovillei]|uniref:Zn-dependent hydrolase n=1 Tax=Colletotrichum scovillei TaxID=1209932 RepID=A0A9P7QZP5_9PEZI|nr:Zn-dependent hydrolase [Colletotrichum scovillei]KAG7052379.1 Zn-dependent hydrolase [Colletotrichum scovillei]KAG7064671.1 Zn-dependent hydrolase [Colletotrichum scovillei]